MSSLPTELATTLSGQETAALIAIAAGSVILLAARLRGGDPGITRRAYSKLYSGAPGADRERHPEAH